MTIQTAADPVAIGIERAEHAGLVLDHCGMDVAQRLHGDEERPFHRGVVAPEADGASRRVVAAAGVRKLKAHRVHSEETRKVEHVGECGNHYDHHAGSGAKLAGSQPEYRPDSLAT